MEQKILTLILMDDLKKARTLLKNHPKDLELVSQLLSKVENRSVPLKTLRSRMPSFVTVNTSYVCNLRCEMCNSGFQDRTYLYEDYKYFLPEQFEELMPWVDSATHVIFVGTGETLYSPHVPEFLQKTAEKNSAITTSGVSLTREGVKTFIESKLNFLNLSFDGTMPAGHGGGKEKYIKRFWEKVALTQKTKKELGSPFPIITLSVVVNAENLDNLEEVFTRALQHDVGEVLLSPMIPSNDALFQKSIFPQYEKSKSRINQIIKRWKKKGVHVSINGDLNTLTNTKTTCPYVDNWMNFHGKNDRPNVCCGSIEMPMEIADFPKNKYWNSFPFRYFRYLHFCSEPDQLPETCQTCWVKDLKKSSQACQDLYQPRDEAQELNRYRTASNLKRKNFLEEAEKLFRQVAHSASASPLKGKAFFHLGEIELMRKDYDKSLAFMRLAVKHEYNFKKAFVYLYLLFMLVGEPTITKRKKKYYPHSPFRRMLSKLESQENGV